MTEEQRVDHDHPEGNLKSQQRIRKQDFACFCREKKQTNVVALVKSQSVLSVKISAADSEYVENAAEKRKYGTAEKGGLSAQANRF